MHLCFPQEDVLTILSQNNNKLYSFLLELIDFYEQTNRFYWRLVTGSDAP